jgi:hypothetical protein
MTRRSPAEVDTSELLGKPKKPTQEEGRREELFLSLRERAALLAPRAARRNERAARNRERGAIEQAFAISARPLIPAPAFSGRASSSVTIEGQESSSLSSWPPSSC